MCYSYAEVDIAKFCQVIYNLVSNAVSDPIVTISFLYLTIIRQVKFTPANGAIDICIRFVRSIDGRRSRVRDEYVRKPSRFMKRRNNRQQNVLFDELYLELTMSVNIFSWVCFVWR